MKSLAENRPLDFSCLTSREVEALLLLASGEQNRRLARHLGIAERTIRAHTASIVRKHRLKSRFEAAIVTHLHADDIRQLETTQRSAA